MTEKLDDYELEIANLYQPTKSTLSKDAKAKLMSNLVEIADKTIKKKQIGIRFDPRDIRALKARASRDGLPYQTLISSIVHKFITGQLFEKA